MASRGGEEGKRELQKYEYLQNRKYFLDEKKTFFISFKGYHVLKKDKWWIETLRYNGKDYI